MSTPQKAPQQKAPQQKAPQQKAPQQKAPQQKAPQQKAPQQKAPQQEAPQQEAPTRETTHEAATYPPELMAAVAELGSALRSLVDTSVRPAVGPGELRAAAEQARALEQRLAAVRRAPGQLPVLDDLVTFGRVYNPVSGVGSALAPPLELRTVDGGRPTRKREDRGRSRCPAALPVESCPPNS